MAAWAAGLGIGLVILMAIAIVAFVVKISPYIWRAGCSFTQILSPPLAVLTNRLIGFPSEAEITTVGEAAILGAILWGGLSLLMSLCFLVLGSSPALVPISLALGVLTGAALGASDMVQANQSAGENLDDYLRF